MGLGTTTQEASSFGFLAPYGPLYLRLATLAERALAVDPSLTLVSLRQLAEAFAKHPEGRAGLIGQHDTQLAQVDLLRLLEQESTKPRGQASTREQRTSTRMDSGREP
jgi:hypothetical protein